MRIILERHLFAPELNKAHINGAVLPAPGCESIQEVRKKSFPTTIPRIVATVKKRYPGQLAWLDRTHTGIVNSRSEAVAFARKLRAGLVDGGVVSVTTELRDI